MAKEEVADKYVAFTTTGGMEAYVPVTELGGDRYLINDGSGRELSLVDSRSSFTVIDAGHTGDMVGEHVVYNALECVEDPDAAHVGLITMVVDSGCTIHLVQVKFLQDLYDVREHRAEITVADGRTLMSTHIGRIKGSVITADGEIHIQLSDVLVVPGLASNLLSVKRVIMAGGRVEFGPDKTEVVMGQARLPCKRNGQLYGLTIVTNRARAGPRMMHSGRDSPALLPEGGSLMLDSKGAYAVTSPATLWHQRLGHRNIADVRRLGELDIGIPMGLTLECKCDTCEMGKHTSQSFPSSATRLASRPFEIIHVDLGTVEVPSLRGHKYFGLVTCERTRYRIPLFMPRKSDFLTCFKGMVLDVAALTGGDDKIRRIHSDNGGEFVGAACEAWFKAQGMMHTTTGAHAPQQNGIAERGIGVVVDMARCLLLESGLGKELWDEAVNTACYLLNRQPTSSLGGDTPYHALHGRHARMEHLRVFGCRAWTQVPQGKRKKLDGKGQRGIMVGYNKTNRRAYRLYDPETGRIYESVHATFDESAFPAKDGQPPPTIQHVLDEPIIIPDDVSVGMPARGDHGTAEGGGVVQPSISEQEQHHEVEDEALDVVGDGEAQDAVGDGEAKLMGRGQRVKKLTLCQIPGCKVGPLHHQAHHVVHRPGLVSLFAHLAMNASADLLGEPRTYKEAMASSEAPFWRESCGDEMRGLIKRKTFTLIPCPPGAKVVGSTWRSKKKVNAQGQVVRYKARLCVQGFTQVWGVDYGDTHSPVVAWEIIRLVFAIAAVLDYEIHHMDVEQAFLQSTLGERILVRQAEGHEVTGPNGEPMVYLLHKSLYGLKQASRNWYKRINSYLTEYGLKPSAADPCLYVLIRDDGTVLLVLLYVDDLAIIGSGLPVVNQFKQAISKEFEMKDLGELEYMLGVQIRRDRANRTLEMLQTGYVDQLLARFNMSGHRPIGTPMDPAKGVPARVTAEDGGSVQELYRSMVGGIMYAALVTRPDIAFSAQALGRHLQSSTDVHVEAAMDVLRYLKGTRELGIKFSPGSDDRGAIVLTGYVDADWASDKTTRRSTSAYVFMIGGGCVSWRSKLQPTVALSSAEAEYVAAAAAAQEAVFLRRALVDLGHGQADPTIIYEDNQGAIAMSENPVHRQRTKHIDVKYNFVRERVEALEIKLLYIPTAEQLADMLTKPLAKIVLARLRARVMGHGKGDK